MIKFDEKSVCWNSDESMNLIFLRMKERYLNDLMLTRGYLYLSTIYEELGIAWDPEKENILFQPQKDMYPFMLEFETFPQKDNILLEIMYNVKGLA